MCIYIWCTLRSIFHLYKNFRIDRFNKSLAVKTTRRFGRQNETEKRCSFRASNHITAKWVNIHYESPWIDRQPPSAHLLCKNRTMRVSSRVTIFTILLRCFLFLAQKVTGSRDLVWKIIDGVVIGRGSLTHCSRTTVDE